MRSDPLGRQGPMLLRLSVGEGFGKMCNDNARPPGNPVSQPSLLYVDFSALFPWPRTVNSTADFFLFYSLWNVKCLYVIASRRLFVSEELC